jgi:hypothetical protein
MENCKCDLTNTTCLYDCFMDGSFDSLLEECKCEGSDIDQVQCGSDCLGLGDCGVTCFSCIDQCRDSQDQCEDLCREECFCISDYIGDQDPTIGGESDTINCLTEKCDVKDIKDDQRQRKAVNNASGSLESSPAGPIFIGLCVVGLACAALFVHHQRKKKREGSFSNQ